MSYSDVAYLIIESYTNKMNTPDLFKKVIKAMKLPEEEFERVGDFFELLLTDKRFTMLENGLWDLKSKHSSKIVYDEDEDDDDFDLDLEEDLDNDEEEDDTEVNYDEDDIEDDDEDDLKDLVIIDESDENYIG